MVSSFFSYFSVLSYADHDHRLQTNLSKWNCNCSSHQWIPHSSWRQDGQVCKPLYFSYLSRSRSKPRSRIRSENVLILPSCRKQVQGFIKFFSYSFLWAFFQWFYSGGGQCGFVQFPTFGMKAWRQTYVHFILFFHFLSIEYMFLGLVSVNSLIKHLFYKSILDESLYHKNFI